uniref:Uncharacterized protein n=1 Tax=viral metagenome TaxID=1070528 RepID=A0A6C0HXI1_9ZZZZ
MVFTKDVFIFAFCHGPAIFYCLYDDFPFIHTIEKETMYVFLI